MSGDINFHFAMDSGAFSIFNKFIAAHGAMRSHSAAYLRTKEFKKYVDDYATFLHKHQKCMDFAVSIDIIQNPQASYDIWRELKKQGLNTVPVLHYGEDLSWAKKYMDDCDYLGVGGLAYGGRTRFMEWGRELLKLIKGKDGLPKWKTHGFAITSFDLMRVFPWTSVDSTSPLALARYGKLCVPRYRIKAVPANYFKEYGVVCVTERLSLQKSSYLNAEPLWKKCIDNYLAYLEITYEEIANSYTKRDVANVFFYNRSAQEISKVRGDLPPLRLYVSGKPGSGEKEFLAALPLLSARGVLDFYYLGTFALVKPAEYFLANGLHNGNQHRDTPVRSKTRPTLHRKH